MPPETELFFPLTDFEPEAPLNVSEWADKNRILTELTSPEPGIWRTARTPYLREPMDSLCDPSVEDIVVRSSTQVGKTELILNIIGFIVDHQPGPMMIVLPRDEDTRNWGRKRLKSMLESSPALRAHLTGREDDTEGKQYALDRMWIKLAGSNSPADLAGEPCRYVLFDEIDKYPRFSGREADPIKLGTERTRNFWNRKHLKVSTPTTNLGAITREYERSDKRRYWVKCPLCGMYQPMGFFQQDDPQTGWIRWPKGAAPEDIKHDKLAWYECGYCKGRIEEQFKESMSAAGVWSPYKMTVNKKGKLEGTRPVNTTRGYQLSALYVPWTSWSTIASEFLESKGRPELLMSFYNSILGEPWLEKQQTTKVSDLKARIGTYPMGQVPEGVKILTCGVDRQEDHWWFVIRGWGVDEESWLIRYGRVEDETDLIHAILTTGYAKEDGEILKVHIANVDSGYKTDEIYTLCRDNQRLQPIKGYRAQIAAPYKGTLLERDTRGRTLAGGLILWSIDTSYYKDKLHRLIHPAPTGESKWHLSEEVGEDYLAQLTAEQKSLYRDKKTGRTYEAWEPVSEHRANHLLDCEVYALVAADMSKVYLLRGPGKPEVFVPKRRQISTGVD